LKHIFPAFGVNFFDFVDDFDRFFLLKSLEFIVSLHELDFFLVNALLNLGSEHFLFFLYFLHGDDEFMRFFHGGIEPLNEKLGVIFVFEIIFEEPFFLRHDFAENPQKVIILGVLGPEELAGPGLGGVEFGFGGEALVVDGVLEAVGDFEAVVVVGLLELEQVLPVGIVEHLFFEVGVFDFTPEQFVQLYLGH